MLQKFAPALTVFVFAASALPGCVSTKSNTSRAELQAEQEDPPAPPAAPAAKLPTAINSVADWDALPKDVREDIIEGDLHGFKTLSLSPRQKVESLTAPEAKAFAEKMTAYMRTHGDMTVQDGSHARVGAAETWVQMVLLSGGTILGGQVAFEQQGCEMPDESAVTFKTQAEAQKAGCEATGGAWSAEGSFNHDGAPFAHGDYMEWTGK